MELNIWLPLLIGCICILMGSFILLWTRRLKQPRIRRSRILAAREAALEAARISSISLSASPPSRSGIYDSGGTSRAYSVDSIPFRVDPVNAYRLSIGIIKTDIEMKLQRTSVLGTELAANKITGKLKPSTVVNYEQELLEIKNSLDESNIKLNEYNSYIDGFKSGSRDSLTSGEPVYSKRRMN